MPYTTWSLEGYKAAVDEVGGRTLSYEESLQIMNKQSKLFKLRDDQALKFLPELGSSAAAAVKWAMKYQDRLCPNGQSDRVRKGYVFEYGSCIGQEESMQASEAIKIFEAMVGGPVKKTVEKATGSYTTTVNVSALWNNPIKDLKTLATAQEVTQENCRDTKFVNPTLNGILPNADLTEFVCE